MRKHAFPPGSTTYLGLWWELACDRALLKYHPSSNA